MGFAQKLPGHPGQVAPDKYPASRVNLGLGITQQVPGLPGNWWVWAHARRNARSVYITRHPGHFGIAQKLPGHVLPSNYPASRVSVGYYPKITRPPGGQILGITNKLPGPRTMRACKRDHPPRKQHLLALLRSRNTRFGSLPKAPSAAANARSRNKPERMVMKRIGKAGGKPVDRAKRLERGAPERQKHMSANLRRDLKSTGTGARERGRGGRGARGRGGRGAQGPGAGARRRTGASDR